jgi:hypothetical protein
MANLSLHKQGNRVRRNCSSHCVLDGELPLLNLLVLLVVGLQARLGLLLAAGLLLLPLDLLLSLLLGLLLLDPRLKFLLDVFLLVLGSLSVGSKNTSTMVTSDVVDLAVIFKLI